jgi:hypothetical protein
VEGAEFRVQGLGCTDLTSALASARLSSRPDNQVSGYGLSGFGFRVSGMWDLTSASLAAQQTLGSPPDAVYAYSQHGSLSGFDGFLHSLTSDTCFEVDAGPPPTTKAMYVFLQISSTLGMTMYDLGSPPPPPRPPPPPPAEVWRLAVFACRAPRLRDLRFRV